MGGPIKEGIMNGIQEPRRIGYATKGNVSVADQAKAFENIFTTPNNVTQEQVTQFANRGTPNLNIGTPKISSFEKMKTNNQFGNQDPTIVPNITIKDKIESYTPEPLTNPFRPLIDYTKKINVYVDENGVKRDRTTGKIITDTDTDTVSDINIEKGRIGMPENISKDMGSKNMPSVKKIIEDKGNIEDTPLTKKERTNNILEMLGYDKAKKNALYDAMIKAGQRVSRTGLGADNLVSDIIQDTSTSYDKPEKLREAANLMDVQQQLKLDQIDASKTNKNQEDLAFYTKQFGGGEAGRKKALNFLTKQSSSAVDAYLTKKKETGSGLDGVKGAIEWMIGNGDIKEGENKGEINKKKFDGLSDFLKDPEGFAKTGPGVYQLSGMVVRINADGTTETVQSFGTIDEKTSSWWSK
jgi:hypothetical protein